MTDFEALCVQLAAATPFARHAGVEIVEIADGLATARLVQAEQLSNHIGTVHAGALFTLGETASGAAMVGAFAEVATQMRPLATSAKISYLKLASGIAPVRIDDHAQSGRGRLDVVGGERQPRKDCLDPFKQVADLLITGPRFDIWRFAMVDVRRANQRQVLPWHEVDRESGPWVPHRNRQADRQHRWIFR